MIIDLNYIITYLIGLLPTVMSVFATIGMVVSFGKQFKLFKVNNTESQDKILEKVAVVMNENYELKKLLKELLTKLDNVERK